MSLSDITNVSETTKFIVLSVGILVAAIILTKITRWGLNKVLDAGAENLKVDATRYKFLKNASSMLIWFIAFGAITLLVPQLKALAITLFAGAGIFVAIVGFAAQAAFSNIISGVFIVIFRPFRVGDIINIGDVHRGVVEDITLRHTVIKNWENARIVIPNSIISNETINNFDLGDQKICRHVEFNISYDSDVDLAMKILREECEKHPLLIDNRGKDGIIESDELVRIRLISFTDSSAVIRAWCWTNDLADAVEMHWDLNKSVKKRFEENGIEIPYPHRTVIMKEASKS